MTVRGFEWHESPQGRPGPNTSRYAYRAGDTEDPEAVLPYWPMIKSTVFIHVVGLYGLTQVPHASTPTLVLAGLLYAAGLIGTFGGNHRLWAHYSYKAHPALEWALMFMSSTVHAVSVLHWVHDHRMHHKYSDTPLDPHNAQRSFFYSHVGWVFWEQPLAVKRAGQAVRMDDIYRNPILTWQHVHYKTLAPVVCYLFPTLLAALWGDAWGGFWVAGFARLLVTLNCIWCTASVAHLFGERSYNEKVPPVENVLVSLLSFGEGFHSYHHAYPHDYSASKDARALFNFTTLFIDAMAAVGLVWGRQRAAPDGRADRDTPMTMEEVASGAKEGRRLLVVEGRVYDLAEFHSVHPGGETVLKSQYGRDATAPFRRQHDSAIVEPSLRSLQCGVIVAEPTHCPRSAA